MKKLPLEQRFPQYPGETHSEWIARLEDHEASENETMKSYENFLNDIRVAAKDPRIMMIDFDLARREELGAEKVKQLQVAVARGKELIKELSDAILRVERRKDERAKLIIFTHRPYADIEDYMQLEEVNFRVDYLRNLQTVK